MVRSKVKLAFIQDAYTRRATHRKRAKSLIKLVREFSTLCDLMSCAIVYGLNSQEPEVWPSVAGVEEVLARFTGMPEHQQSLKMANQESLIEDCIQKVEKRLMKLQRENRRKEVSECLLRWVRGEATRKQTMLDLTNMGRMFLEEKISDISYMIEERKKANLARELEAASGHIGGGNLRQGAETGNGIDVASEEFGGENVPQGTKMIGSKRKARA